MGKCNTRLLIGDSTQYLKQMDFHREKNYTSMCIHDNYIQYLCHFALHHKNDLERNKKLILLLINFIQYSQRFNNVTSRGLRYV